MFTVLGWIHDFEERLKSARANIANAQTSLVLARAKYRDVIELGETPSAVTQAERFYQNTLTKEAEIKAAFDSFLADLVTGWSGRIAELEKRIEARKADLANLEAFRAMDSEGKKTFLRTIHTKMKSLETELADLNGGKNADER